MYDGKLSKADMNLVRLPKEFWHTTREALAPSLAKPIGRYLDKIKALVLKEGVSLLITGERGTGKSGAASVIAKTARSLGIDVYWRYAWQYREDRRDRLAYNEDISSFERCMNVPLLVIDDFREEDAVDKFYGTHDFEGLLCARAQHRRPTIMTSAYSDQDPALGLVRLRKAVPRLVEVRASGFSMRAEDTNKYASEILGGE